MVIKKRAILVHGWGGSPNKDWFTWLKKELENRNWEVLIPEMPNTFHPTITAWVNHLNQLIKNPDNNTYLIGHSMGGPAIMRYLEQLPKETKVGGAIFVAGFFNLTDELWDETYTPKIAKPWLETPLDFKKIKQHTSKFIAIQSDNDPYIPLSDKEIFKEKLGAEIIVEHNKGHFSGADGTKELHILLNKLLEISK